MGRARPYALRCPAARVEVQQGVLPRRRTQRLGGSSRGTRLHSAHPTAARRRRGRELQSRRAPGAATSSLSAAPPPPAPSGWLVGPACLRPALAHRCGAAWPGGAPPPAPPLVPLVHPRPSERAPRSAWSPEPCARAATHHPGPRACSDHLVPSPLRPCGRLSQLPVAQRKIRGTAAPRHTAAHRRSGSAAAAQEARAQAARAPRGCRCRRARSHAGRERRRAALLARGVVPSTTWNI